jgi:hypothetical protein
MTMRIRPGAARALLAALLPLAASCADGTGTELGGEYVGRLDSPFSVEGGTLIELTSADLREVWAPGRIMVARGTSERTVRVLLLNPPRNLNGGPIAFRVRMANGAVPPRATVLAVSSPLNLPRAFVGGYTVRFDQPQPDPAASAALAPLAQTTPVPFIPFARAVAPYFPGGLPLTPPEVTRIDGSAGNGNRVYDIGDLRGYLAQFASEIPPETRWTR